MGLAALPFGFFTGFYSVALPLLLTSRGMPLDRVGTEILAWALVPPFISFLLVPLIDSVLPRVRWAALWVVLMMASSFGAVQSIDLAVKGHTLPLKALVFLGALVAQLYSSTLGGMVPNVIDPERNAAIGVWLNIGNLGGVGVGGTLGIVAVQRLGFTLGGVVLACCIGAPALLLLGVRPEGRVPRRFGETARRILVDLWAVSRTRAAAIGLLVFLTPAATFAASNLFSGLGRDFGASDATTTWITGIGGSLLAGAGCLLGGWLSTMMDRRALFVGSGMMAALGSVLMAFGPRVPGVYAAGVSFYQFMAGVNYTACSAAAFDILGENNPLSATQYAVLMAAANVAIWTVTQADSHGYRSHGARGLLLTDATFSLLCGSVLLVVIRIWGGSGRETRLPAKEQLKVG